VVGFEVHETDSADHATELARPSSLGVAHGPKACTPPAANRCCTATRAPPSRPPQSSPCSPGSASRRPTLVRGSVTTIPSSKPCSALSPRIPAQGLR
jgi:hypothetical protein